MKPRFEDHLASFTPRPAPADLRSEVLDNACPGDAEPAGGRRARPFLLVYGGALAAAWVAILVLHARTPTLEAPALAEGPTTLLVPSTELGPEVPRAFLAKASEIERLLGE